MRNIAIFLACLTLAAMFNGIVIGTLAALQFPVPKFTPLTAFAVIIIGIPIGIGAMFVGISLAWALFGRHL